MSNVIRFSSINQYREIISTINDIAKYHNLTTKPTLRFRGTVKLHGTNAAIVYSPNSDIMIQSRNNLYTLKDMNESRDASHMGFNEFAHRPEINIIVKHIYDTINNNSNNNNGIPKIIIYGEWAGKGIQRGVAISELDKAFYMFGIRIITNESEKPESLDSGTWFDIANIKLPDIALNSHFYNLMDFKHWYLNIDFNDPKAIQNQLVSITNEVEQECPVAAALNISGCGEGVVWQSEWITPGGTNKRLLFKVKGEKHSISKVKTLAEIDPELHASTKSFIEYAVTENRINQAISEVEQSKGLEPGKASVADLGDLIRWVFKDILKEESDVIKASNLEVKNLSKAIGEKARTLFLNKLALF